MKKVFLILIFLGLLVTKGSAQTDPSFLQLKDAPFSDIRTFGVVGDGVTDDWAALKEAIEAGGVIVIPSEMDIAVDAPDANSQQIIITKDTYIFGPGSKITQLSSGGKEAFAVLNLYVAVDNVDIVVSGLELDGSSVSCFGLYINRPIEFSGGNALISLCNVHDMDAGARSYSSGGILINGRFDTTKIEQNSVKDITRNSLIGTAGANSATGIAVASSQNAVSITANRIENILSNAALSWNDADGIYVNGASFTSELLPEHKVVISENLVKNCSKRHVKLQTLGADVYGNTFIADDGVLYAGSVFVDCLYGGSNVHHNNFLIASSTLVTIGPSSGFLGGANLISQKQTFNWHHNTFKTHQPISGTGFTSFDSGDAVVNLESNVFDGDFAWGIVITCHSVSKHANKMVLNCRNNTFINNTVTNSIVYPTGAYFQTEDFLETQTFRIVNNSIDYVAGTPGNPGTPIYYSSIHPYRGNLQLSDNSGWSKGLVYQEATLRRILPGSNFYFVGTGTSPVAEFGDEMDSCPFGTRGFQVTRSARHATLASATSKVNVYIPDYATASSSWIFSAPYP